MATTETKAKASAEERVSVFIPKGMPKEDPNLFISVNGVNYLIPRGKTSLVPANVAKIIERHYGALERYERTSNELIEKTKSPTNA